MKNDRQNDFGVIAIGRNEGERLKQCLRSLPSSATAVYVDSGSTDGSDIWAREYGVQVVALDLDIPFTAARARNAGFKRLVEIKPNIPFVQFVDGDCELVKEWPETALSFLRSHVHVAAVFGRRRERNPEQSVYNKLCDWEWDGPVGETIAFGGDVMLRTSSFQAVNGYLESLVAGEEPELALRLRREGWQIWRLGADMSIHDAAILQFRQWWNRSVRSGYAFAAGSYLHGAPPERHWVWESRRASIWGIWLPIACLVMSLTIGRWGLALCLLYPLQMLRQMFRSTGPFYDRAVKGFFQVLSRFPEGVGQLKFLRDQLLNRQAVLIEYKYRAYRVLD
jgi:glycosyltransferase involved in cell wall biosynthesis